MGGVTAEVFEVLVFIIAITGVMILPLCVLGWMMYRSTWAGYEDLE
jgi:hypothetical protein